MWICNGVRGHVTRLREPLGMWQSPAASMPAVCISSFHGVTCTNFAFYKFLRSAMRIHWLKPRKCKNANERNWNSPFWAFRFLQHQSTEGCPCWNAPQVGSWHEQPKWQPRCERCAQWCFHLPSEGLEMTVSDLLPGEVNEPWFT